MIDAEIIKIASDTKFAGLKNTYTHKSSVKNSLCGDSIKIELIVGKKFIKSMRYETESCILCEAAASLLARKIKYFYLKDLKKDFCKIKKLIKDRKFNSSTKFKEFNQLLNKANDNRINCVILPIEAILKAFKIRK